MLASPGSHGQPEHRNARSGPDQGGAYPVTSTAAVCSGWLRHLAQKGRARAVHDEDPGGVHAAWLTTAHTSRSQHHARITIIAAGNACVCGLWRRPDRDHHRRPRPRLGGARGSWGLRLPRAALRRSPHRQPAVASPAAAGCLAGRPRRHPLRAEQPAAAQPRPDGSDERGLPVPQRVHADAGKQRRRRSAGARVDPRRPLHARRRPGLRRHQTGGGRHRGRHHQFPAGRSWLPRPPGAGVGARRPVRQLRADGPAGCPALGAEQHPPVRRRPGQCRRSRASRPVACPCSPT